MLYIFIYTLCLLVALSLTTPHMGESVVTPDIVPSPCPEGSESQSL